MKPTKLKYKEPSLPKISEFRTVAAISDDWFGWELSESEIEEHKKTYGFIYKCLADNTSNTQEWLGFDIGIGRNVISAVFNHSDSHLLNGVVTLMYPENGLSPSMQAALVSMICRHPQAADITELRIITRSAWFLSDCKSVRVMHMEHKTSSQKDSVYYVPKFTEKPNEKDRLKILRKDPYFEKGKRAIFLNFASQKEDTGIYLGEDNDFVYWSSYRDDVGKLLRTDHYNMWYKLNAVLLNNKQCDDLIPLVKEGKSHKEIREHLRQYEYNARI